MYFLVGAERFTSQIRKEGYSQKCDEAGCPGLARRSAKGREY